MKKEIKITDIHRQAIANELAKMLADENVLYIKTKNAHWNIEGADFYDKHKFFETQFGQLECVYQTVLLNECVLFGHYASSHLTILS